MKLIIFFVNLICTFLLAYCRHVDFYRKDYTYIQEFDAFYKVHLDVKGSPWQNAFFTCDDEGANLFYPKVQDEWTIVKNLTDTMAEVSNVTKILVGLHDEFRLGEFITPDGHPTPYPLPLDGRLLPQKDGCLTMDINTGKFSFGSCPRSSNTPLPFVCKKVDDRVSCPTIDDGYKFLNTSRREENSMNCYKVNKNPKTWQEAMKTCFMEGALLTVIENIDKAEQIKNIIELGETYFVGVRKLLPRGEYITVKGQKFSDMYQNPYIDPNPYDPYNNVPNENGYLPDENGQYPDENGQYPIVQDTTECGTIRNRDNNNLYTETDSCEKHLPFICEMEVHE